MCLMKEKSVKRIGKSTIMWKVFKVVGEELRSIHFPNDLVNSTIPQKSRRKFSERRGFMCFKEEEEAKKYARALQLNNPYCHDTWESFPISVPKNAKIVEGLIQYNLVHAEKKACRVSSYSLIT